MNNCSNTGKDKEIFGICVIEKPVSQCICNEKLRKGGEDCSITFCLNECKPNGNCNYNNGTCNCNEDYFGEDCSILIPGFDSFGFFNRFFFVDFFTILCFILLDILFFFE